MLHSGEALGRPAIQLDIAREVAAMIAQLGPGEFWMIVRTSRGDANESPIYLAEVIAQKCTAPLIFKTQGIDLMKVACRKH